MTKSADLQNAIRNAANARHQLRIGDGVAWTKYWTRKYESARFEVRQVRAGFVWSRAHGAWIKADQIGWQ